MSFVRGNRALNFVQSFLQIFALTKLLLTQKFVPLFLRRLSLHQNLRYLLFLWRLFAMRFMQLLLLENYEFCHRHYRPGLSFFYTHYLHHVLPVLFEKILKLMLEH